VTAGAASAIALDPAGMAEQHRQLQQDRDMQGHGRQKRLALGQHLALGTASRRPRAACEHDGPTGSTAGEVLVTAAQGGGLFRSSSCKCSRNSRQPILGCRSRMQLGWAIAGDYSAPGAACWRHSQHLEMLPIRRCMPPQGSSPVLATAAGPVGSPVAAVAGRCSR
jgi:hypothetical protein